MAALHCIFILFLCVSCRVLGLPEEHCEDDVFRANCGPDEMVIMDKALYGRMAIGKCVKAGLGYLGCHTNVLHTLDKVCSGRQACHIEVQERAFTSSNPCFEELKMYLETDYHCQRVLSTDTVCSSSAPQLVLQDKTNMMSSTELSRLSCLQSRPGRTQLALQVRASPGQYINITLLDFEYNMADVRSSCATYGHVKDAQTQTTGRFCGGQRRVTNVMVSNSNVLQLTLYVHTDWPNYAIQFEVIGCADIPAEGKTWAQRDGATMTVGCLNSKQTWTLRCDGNTWTGTIGNCSQDPELPPAASATQKKAGAFSSDVTIALISCAAILICVTILVIAVNCWKKYTVENYMLRMQQQTLHQMAHPVPEPESEYMMPVYPSKAGGAEEGEDALYDFCFMPGTGNTMPNRTLPNNLHSVRTLPVRPDQPKVNNSTVRFKTHSPRVLLKPDPTV